MSLYDTDNYDGGLVDDTLQGGLVPTVNMKIQNHLEVLRMLLLS